MTGRRGTGTADGVTGTAAAFATLRRLSQECDVKLRDAARHVRETGGAES